MSPSLTATTIFWPLGLSQKSGFCYGWKHPAYCVAGILDVETVGSLFGIRFLLLIFLQEEEANRVLESACTAPAWRALQDSCQGKPEILAYCEYNAREDRLKIVSWCANTKSILLDSSPNPSAGEHSLF